MARKPITKPKLTDAPRHKPFVEMAREIGAAESPESFEKAFKKVVKRRPSESPRNRGG